jgi:S1-C subfamily serine protease
MLLSAGGVEAPGNAVAQAAEAVVTVRAGTSSGTGFVIGRGEIVTAAHVVGDWERVNVRIDGQHFDAEVVARDDSLDLALLLVSETGLPALSLAETLPPLGEDLVAFSAADGTVAATRGILSAYETIGGIGHLRTDAAVNTGSSGGPILNAAGNVIGVTVTKTEGREGVAHAVTASVVSEFLAATPPAGTSQEDQVRTGASPEVPRWPWLAFLVGGLGLAIAATTRTVRAHRAEPADEIRLGASRIRIGETTTYVDEGDNYGA